MKIKKQWCCSAVLVCSLLVVAGLRTSALAGESDQRSSNPAVFPSFRANGVDTATGASPGDFNGDASYTTADIDLLAGAIAKGGMQLTFDLTGDGVVTLADQDEWLRIAGHANLGPGISYLHGDANLDGIVDGVDFGHWNSNKFTAVSAWSAGNFDGTGAVDPQDFSIWNANKFTSATDKLSIVSVPEPAGLVGVVALLMVAIASGRRSR